jgi:hypothetical protein
MGSAPAPPWGSGLELSPSVPCSQTLLPQPVLLPVRLFRLLPACLGLLSAGGVLSARTKLLQPRLRLLLRLLSSAKSNWRWPYAGSRAKGCEVATFSMAARGAVPPDVA